MRYIALLRGINLGGNVMVKMEDLRKAFEDLGFENVKTYINSGNVAFDVSSPRVSKSAKGIAKLESNIESTVEKMVGRQVAVMVREQKDIEQILKNNPFDGQYESHKHMHVLFLKEKMPKEKEAQLHAAALPGEKYEVCDREIYNLLPQGVAGSLLTKGFFEKKPRVSYTGRNWRTVEKLSTL